MVEGEFPSTEKTWCQSSFVQCSADTDARSSPLSRKCARPRAVAHFTCISAALVCRHDATYVVHSTSTYLTVACRALRANPGSACAEGLEAQDVLRVVISSEVIRQCRRGVGPFCGAVQAKRARQFANRGPSSAVPSPARRAEGQPGPRVPQTMEE